MIADRRCRYKKGVVNRAAFRYIDDVGREVRPNEARKVKASRAFSFPRPELIWLF
ncbi:hypothetical protein [Burkholderia pseudomallei]|uniref:hypothetical protein n=1 Tax=Burkholderia pseudomallei TaxID=28450 RepID=UPI0001A42415|nr:hypothetical protein [Burkholderia pseudomallei]EEP50501.1 hypothetical protein GBP346_B1211 [Burkholderia pseudomallei MSHR346]MBM5578496.1 hypothetical protein [Burkholderia pseudomallei]MBM5586017.1 hypothetical protein [Burkholderia pseudomallei]MBM5690648.1 hypothetical protein [Burkholderia pseudomallei]